MKFYYRNNELKDLETVRKQAEHTSKMTVFTGRRRIGKTTLALELVKDKPFVYLFVAKKAQSLLCRDFCEEIQRQLGVTIHGKLETFRAVFSFLMDLAKEQHFTLIIDEFQGFYSIDASVYSDVQQIWDLNKNKTRMNLIFIGSIYSLIHKIFENEKEPLFGRADRIIRLTPFSIAEMKLILADHNIKSLNQLFDFYLLTGCGPKYLELLLTNNCYTLKDCLDFMLTENSPFLYEGKNQLIEEFGKEYSIYFSILELIARGKTSSSEIESIIQKNVSAYLNNLVHDYKILAAVKPFDARPNSKTQKFYIVDNFLRFWFRYFHRNLDAIELRNFDYIKKMILLDYDTYSGRVIEKFLFELLADTKQYNRMGTYWERGHKNEIDIVAVDDLNKTILLAEVKKNSRRNSLPRLEYRSEKLLEKYSDYEVKYLQLSLENAKDYLV